MKRLALIASLSLPACMVQGSDTTPAPAVAGPAGGVCDDSADVAGELAAAAPAEPGQLTGCFGNGDDVDMLALTAPPDAGGVVYRVELVGSAKLWPCATVLDGDQQEQSDICAEKEGGSASGWLHVAPGTTAYLKVHPFVGFVGSQGYALRLDAAPVADADEPNDSREQATALALGEPHQAFFSAAVNAGAMTPDFYRIDVPADGTLAIDVEHADPKVWWFVKLVDADGNEVHEASAKSEGAALRTTAKVHEGSYTLELGLYVGELASAGRGATPARLTAPYTLTAALQ